MRLRLKVNLLAGLQLDVMSILVDLPRQGNLVGGSRGRQMLRATLVSLLVALNGRAVLRSVRLQMQSPSN